MKLDDWLDEDNKSIIAMGAAFLVGLIVFVWAISAVFEWGPGAARRHAIELHCDDAGVK